MFKKIKKKLESKRTSNNVFWRTLVWIKDFIFYKLNRKKHSYMVVCNSKRFMFVRVFKNASSFLRDLAYRNDQISWEEGEVQKKISFRRSRSQEYKDYIKFAVYRDPVERFLSLYKNKILGHNKDFEERYKEDGIKNCDLKTFICFTKKELKNKMVCDPHLLPQYLLYKRSDVDYIVPINKLNLFIERKLKCNADLRLNRTDNIFLKISERDFNEIKKIYSEDYKIKPNF